MNTCTLYRAEATSDTRVKALVVDDSPMMLKILARILEEAGNIHLVGSATDGCQALRLASALSPDLVLMDVHMPHLNGIQATRYLKGFKRPPIVIIVTTDDSSSERSMAERAGADGFIIKEGNLRHRLLGMLQDLFGPGNARRVAVSGIHFRNPRAGKTNRNHGT
jgi:CheY-like chemotaxis protein